MKIVNKKKFIRSIIILFVIVFIIPLIFAKVTFSYKQVEYISIYVDYGDTLWNIAKTQQRTNEYYKDKDVRYIISDIKKVNNLSTSDIYVEQELKIPTV